MAVGTVQIGRIGLAAANGGDGYSFEEPTEIKQSGRQLELSGFQQETTIAALTWLRDQILGLTQQVGETAIPVRFSDYTHLNGYYRVGASSADRSPAGLAWSVSLERITDWISPRVDLYLLGGLLTNSFSVAAGYLMYAVPAGATWDQLGTAGTRSTGDSVSIPYDSVSSIGGVTNTVTNYAVDPQYWYRTGCRVEFDVASTGTYYAVVGRRSFGVEGTTGRLRISNGVVRATWDTANGHINVSWWDGSQWETATAFTVMLGGAAGNDQTAVAATVIRNNTDECSIRYTLTESGVNYVAYCDLTVRRGSRNVIGYIQTTGGATFTWGVRFTTSASSTSITSGVRRTSNNAGGNRELLVSKDGTTLTTGTGRISQGSGSASFLFGIGIEIGGSGAAGIDTAANQALEFFYPIQPSSLVVAV